MVSTAVILSPKVSVRLSVSSWKEDLLARDLRREGDQKQSSCER